MEFFHLPAGEVKEDNDKNRDWYLHECGIVDSRTGNDFLETLEEKVDYVFQQELYSRASTIADRLRDWVESREVPLTIVDLKKCSVMVCRKMSYYTSKQYDFTLLDNEMFPDTLAEAMTEVLYRNGEIDEKEQVCCLWLMAKMGYKVSWEDKNYEWDKCDW